MPPNKIKTAMLLAAGLGTRMRPLTDNLPKPLISVRGRTLIDRMLDNLVENGVEKAVVNTFYLPEMIEKHLRARQDIEIIISHETERLETGGGILNALPHLGDEPFFVTSCDVIIKKPENEKSGFVQLSEEYAEGSEGALLLIPLENTYGYDGHGDFNIDDDGKLKWREEGRSAGYVFSTIQILHPQIFARAEVQQWGKVFPLKNIYDLYLDRLRPAIYKGRWYHIGTPEALEGLMEG